MSAVARETMARNEGKFPRIEAFLDRNFAQACR